MKPGAEIALAGMPQRMPAIACRYTVAVVVLFVIAALFFIAVAAPYLLLEGRLMAIYETRKLGLWLHVALGSIALLAGPWQLWLGLNQRTGKLHRGLGRIYVAAIAGSVLAAVHLAVNTPLGPVFAGGALGLALAWTATTGVAVFAVIKRDIAQHRQWMMRSYLVTLSFVLFRLFDPLLEYGGMS
ncbi:MAG TPA: DUF2306 domain-containing protein [Xanthomonadaceae bacterium]|nr:DUF2306 domain-containing protein [Xanthomonadaceae bacterium]